MRTSHVEFIGTTISRLLDGRETGRNRREVATPLKITLNASNIQHYLVGAQGALPVDAAGNPCSGCYVYNSGNLIAGWWYRCPGAAIVVGVAGDDI